MPRKNCNADQVRGEVGDYVVEQLHDDEAVLVAVETGGVKKGIDTVGVRRQYTGTVGRIENSQAAAGTPQWTGNSAAPAFLDLRSRPLPGRRPRRQYGVRDRAGVGRPHGHPIPRRRPDCGHAPAMSMRIRASSRGWENIGQWPVSISVRRQRPLVSSLATSSLGSGSPSVHLM